MQKKKSTDCVEAMGNDGLYDAERDREGMHGVKISRLDREQNVGEGMREIWGRQKSEMEGGEDEIFENGT